MAHQSFIDVTFSQRDVRIAPARVPPRLEPRLPPRMTPRVLPTLATSPHALQPSVHQPHRRFHHLARLARRFDAKLPFIRRYGQKIPGWARVTCLALMIGVFLFGIYTNSAHAVSQGPLSAASTSDCTNDGSIGTIMWTNPSNAFSNNTTYATASVDGTTSNYIKCTNFSFRVCLKRW